MGNCIQKFFQLFQICCCPCTIKGSVLGNLFRWAASFVLARPPHSFDSSKVPTRKPDYTVHTSENWACFPSLTSRSNTLANLVLPTEEVVPDDARKADVFFVHPTTFFGPAWNQDLYDKNSSLGADEQLQLVWALQATAFNAVCRIYAPRYRQASLAAYVYDKSSGRKALDVAYSDVKRAFQEFIKVTKDRPIVLASHSQGGYHLSRILEDEIENGPSEIRERLCAVYLIGSKLPIDKFKRSFPSLHASRGPADSGRVVIGWDTRTEVPSERKRMYAEAPGHFYSDSRMWEDCGSRKILCTNPFTWKSNVEEEPSFDDPTEFGDNSGILTLRANPSGCTLKEFLGPKPYGLIVNEIRLMTDLEMWGENGDGGSPKYSLQNSIQKDEECGFLLLSPLPKAVPIVREEGESEEKFEKRKAYEFDFTRVAQTSNLHNYDYNLFWKSIRKNVKLRVDNMNRKNK
eukprot:g1755.t1